MPRQEKAISRRGILIAFSDHDKGLSRGTVLADSLSGDNENRPPCQKPKDMEVCPMGIPTIVSMAWMNRKRK